MPPLLEPVVPRWEEKYRRLPAGLKATPHSSEPDWPVTRRKGATHVVGGDDADLHVAAVLGDVQVADGGAGDVVDAGQRRVAGQVVVVGDGDGVGDRVVGPDAVVALGGEEAGAVAVVAAFAAVELLHAGHLPAGGGRAAVGSGTLTQDSAPPDSRSTCRVPADRSPQVVGTNR